MVIEHTFVTTRESDDTMRAAMQFLAARGFERPEAAAFAVGGGTWNTLELRRGRTKAARAKSIVELPQTAHVQWDRGRVTVVLTIQPSHAWGGTSGGFTLTGGDVEGNPRKMKLHTSMLMAIATGLEELLARNAPPEVAMRAWDAAEQHAREAAQYRRTRNTIIISIVLVVIFALIALIVYGVMSS